MAAPEYLCPFASVAGSTDHVMKCSEVVLNGAVKATITIDMTNATSDLTYTALDYGAYGNDISVTHTDPGANDAELTVTVSGTDIDISLATDEAGAITSTAALVKAAVNAHAEASALVLCEDEGSGTGVVNAAVKTNLATGAYFGCALYDATREQCSLAQHLRWASELGQHRTPVVQ